MSDATVSKLIPRGSLGLKMLLVCFLVLLMSVPLMFVGVIVHDRERLAGEVTAEIGERAGGAQIVGGPMLIVPYSRTQTVTDVDGVRRETVQEGSYIVFAERGSAEAALSVEERRRGIYRAAVYDADIGFSARFRPLDALEDVGPSTRFDWSGAQIAMFVRDSRAISNAAEITLGDGTTATMEPSSVIGGAFSVHQGVDAYGRGYAEPTTLQAFAAPVRFDSAPEEFSLTTRLRLGGAQRFALAAFAQNTEASIRGDRTDASIQGFFQSTETTIDDGFRATWTVPFVARAVEKAADLASFNLGATASRDMAVSFVGADDVYQGVARAVRYAIMFIGIVFLSTIIFEALSGRKAHPAQYILVGLAQSVFYLLLLAITEMIGFPLAFAIAAGATVLLLAFYAGSSARSFRVGISSLVGLGLLYGVMYVLMTIEDFAFFAGSVVAFLVIAAAMITTRRINWYGVRAAQEAEPTAA